MSCKDVLWRRWTREYLYALRERHNCRGSESSKLLKVGDVVSIRGEESNRAKWPLGVVSALFKGRDGSLRAVKLRAGKSYLERPVQHLFPLELSCDSYAQTQETRLNPEAPPFRSRRDAAVAAELRISDAVQAEET